MYQRGNVINLQMAAISSQVLEGLEQKLATVEEKIRCALTA